RCCSASDMIRSHNAAPCLAIIPRNAKPICRCDVHGVATSAHAVRSDVLPFGAQLRARPVSPRLSTVVRTAEAVADGAHPDRVAVCGERETVDDVERERG